MCVPPQHRRAKYWCNVRLDQLMGWFEGEAIR